ncbi:hypothetical protein B0H14DRAFT_3498554 [Mycena olivaceomarginata]|nr:hypothetical protein B0H14DRAFT_3498554 [Mycena olivaceomarginata]
MSREEREQHDTLMDMADPLDDDDGGYEGDVLRGSATADISHAGEWINDEEADQADKDLQNVFSAASGSSQSDGPDAKPSRRVAAQLDAMTDAYMSWSLAMAEEGVGGKYVQPETSVVEDMQRVLVVDLFKASYKDVLIVRGGRVHGPPRTSGVLVSACRPSSEVFATFTLSPPAPYLASQFSTAVDAYLSIHAEVDKRVKPGERVHVLVDGTPVSGASKQRPSNRQPPDKPQYVSVPGASKERRDNRQAPGNHYLSRAEVDEGFVPGTGEDEDEGAGCEEHWENMKEDVTARAWGMYNETGIFPALCCRHGFVLVVVDMVQSGEL